jgi:hypothetical protein
LLHRRIGSTLKSIYLLHANIDRLVFSTNRCFATENEPFELKVTPKYVYLCVF